jgi:hypothetical protein
MNDYGFIITRHVNSELTNKYWNNCVKCIRQFYPYRKIVIIDDNSNQDFIQSFYNYENIEIIQSEFPGRGELLPYYYFIKNKFFDNAIIIHDSVFFHTRINFEKLITFKVVPFWYFHSDIEYLSNTIDIISTLTNSFELRNKLTLNNKVLGLDNFNWFGCFGSQSFINRNFLIYLENKYKITNMINIVKCRKDRCCLERVFGVIFCSEYPLITEKRSLLGNIFNYQKFARYSFNNYEHDIQNKKITKPLIKVWTGR